MADLLSESLNPTEKTIIRVVGERKGNISPYIFEKEKQLGHSYAGASRYCHILENKGLLSSKEEEGERKSKKIVYSLTIWGFCAYILILYAESSELENKSQKIITALNTYKFLMLEFEVFLNEIDVLSSIFASEPQFDMVSNLIKKKLIPECEMALRVKGLPNFFSALIYEPFLPNFWANTPYNDQYPKIFDALYTVFKKYPGTFEEIEILNKSRDWYDIENEIYFESKFSDKHDFVSWINEISKKYLI